MLINNVKSKAFAVPRHPDTTVYATESLIMMQVRRSTGTAALTGLLIAAAFVAAIVLWGPR